MPKDEKTVNPYQHLIDATTNVPSEVEPMGQTFHKVSLGGSQSAIDEVTGTEIDPKKYNSAGFPGFNYDNIFVIPLLIHGQRRVLYASKFDGSSRPPDCWSPNSITPAQPGISVMGQTLIACGTCPFSIYGSDPACKPRPGIYGLALFNIAKQLTTIPVYLDVATMSRHAVSNMIMALNRPLQLEGETHMLAPFTRVIKCGRQLISSKRGPVTGWTMSLLGPTSAEVDPEEGEPIPNFTPENIILEIQSLLDAATGANNAMIRPVTLLTGGTDSPPLLAGGVTPTPHKGSVDMALEVTPDTF